MSLIFVCSLYTRHNSIANADTNVEKDQATITTTVENVIGEINEADVEKARENTATDASTGIVSKKLFAGGPGIEKGYDISEDIAKFGNVQALLDNLYQQGVWNGNDYTRDVDKKNGKHKFYDLIHLRSYQFGLKPNYFATVMALESGGDPLSDSGMACFGLFQINKVEWNKFAGVEYIKMDGSVGTITMDGSGYEGYSKDTSIKGNPWDPEANSYVGAALLRSSVKKYANPWIVYGVHNGGEGFAIFVKKYLGEDTKNMSLDQILNIIDERCTWMPHGWKGETNTALNVLCNIYSRNTK